jgi:hypothetical protein
MCQFLRVFKRKKGQIRGHNSSPARSNINTLLECPVQWYMPVPPATQEAEGRRSV